MKIRNCTVLMILLTGLLLAQKLLIPMDLSQTDHLKAYGVAYWALEQGFNVEWLLNYEGGSFIIPADKNVIGKCRVMGVSHETIDGVTAAKIYSEIENNNMEVVLLEKAPKIAIYTPASEEPWDDAVTLALTYAEIPYETLWDEEVLAGKLSEYDWLHLHHEDFTGQFGKFYASYRNALWYQQEVASSQEVARKYGFTKVSDLKYTVATKIKQYVTGGGFLFAMCSATDTWDIALSAYNTDIVPQQFDGDPVSPNAQEELDYNECLAFENFSVILDPMVYEHSNIDVKPERTSRVMGAEANYFTLFDFSAKYDPVPSMLVQNHVNVVKDFLGQCSAYNAATVKPSVVVLATFEDKPVDKYLHGNQGKGTWTFLAGHDPEDYMHFIGDPPTELNLHKNSPGYRLILNNILFPAAQKKEHKT